MRHLQAHTLWLQGGDKENSVIFARFEMKSLAEMVGRTGTAGIPEWHLHKNGDAAWKHANSEHWDTYDQLQSGK